jgi:hypothetical protein
MVAGLAVLMILAVARLSFGPVALDFLTPYVERGLSAEDGSYKVTVQKTVLIWGGWERTIDIQLSGLRVVDAAGAEQAAVPSLAVGFSLRALAFGRVAPARLELFHPRLTVVRRADGGFAFGDGVPGAATDGETARLGGDLTGAVIAHLVGPPSHDGPLGYLRLVSLFDADLVFDDKRTGVVLRAPGSQLVLSRDSGGLGISARVNIDGGQHQAKLELAGGYNAAEKALDIETRLAGLVPAEFAGIAPVLAPLGQAKLPLSGKVLARINLDGAIGAIAVDMEAGSGTLDAPAYFDAPVMVRAAGLKGQLAAGGNSFVLEAFTADFNGPRIALSGKGGRADGRVNMTFEAGARNVSSADLRRLWPKGVADNGRTWVLENIEDGGVSELNLTAAISGRADASGVISGLKLDKLDGGFDIDGVTLHYLRPLPPLTGLRGRATLAPGALNFTVSQGRMGRLRVGDGKVKIYDLDTDIERLDLEAVAGGPIADVVKVLNHPRLNLVKALGISPAAIKGDGATRLVMKFPLRKDLKFDHIEIAAASNLTGVALPAVAMGNDLTDGDLVLHLDKRGMDIAGKVKLGGVPADLKWTENFYSGALFRSRYLIKGTADDAARNRFGLDFLGPHVNGPVLADLIITRYDAKRMTLTGAFNVKDAGLIFGELGWRKLPGVAGFARVNLTIENDRAKAIERLTLRAGDLSASGSIALRPDGKSISAFDFSELKYGESDYHVRGRFRDDGGMVIDVAGSRADIRSFLKQRGDGKPKVPLDVTVDLGAVRAAPGAVISNVKGRLVRDTVDWNAMDIAGTVGKGTPLTLRIAPDKGQLRLAVVSADAGATLKAFDISDKVVGGTLNIGGQYDLSKASRPLTGHFAMRDFHMVKAPFLAKLLSVASLTGLLDTLTGQGISFKRADVPFVKDRDRITLKESRAHGAAIGFTAQGSIDLEKDTLDLKGTLVPAYTLNSVFGSIPLIGRILVPEKGSGLFAATYTMRGPIEDPAVSVNPLATLAPGFLRGLFDIFDEPAKDAAPSTAPKASPPPVVSSPAGPVGPVTPAPVPTAPAPASRR